MLQQPIIGLHESCHAFQSILMRMSYLYKSNNVPNEISNKLVNKYDNPWQIHMSRYDRKDLNGYIYKNLSNDLGQANYQTESSKSLSKIKHKKKELEKNNYDNFKGLDYKKELKICLNESKELNTEFLIENY